MKKPSVSKVVEEIDLCEKRSQLSRRADFVIFSLAVFVVVLAAISLMLGRYPIDPGQAVAMLANCVFPIEPTWLER